MLTTLSLELLRAIESIHAELPTLTGGDWCQVEHQLAGLLEQLGSDPSSEAVTHAQVLMLFSRYPQAHTRLVAVIPQQMATKGIATVLRNLLHRPVTRYTDIACPDRVWLRDYRLSYG